MQARKQVATVMDVMVDEEEESKNAEETSSYVVRYEAKKSPVSIG